MARKVYGLVYTTSRVVLLYKNCGHTHYVAGRTYLPLTCMLRVHIASFLPEANHSIGLWQPFACIHPCVQCMTLICAGGNAPN